MVSISKDRHTWIVENEKALVIPISWLKFHNEYANIVDKTQTCESATDAMVYEMMKNGKNFDQEPDFFIFDLESKKSHELRFEEGDTGVDFKRSNGVELHVTAYRYCRDSKGNVGLIDMYMTKLVREWQWEKNFNLSMLRVFSTHSFELRSRAILCKPTSPFKKPSGARERAALYENVTVSKLLKI